MDKVNTSVAGDKDTGRRETDSLAHQEKQVVTPISSVPVPPETMASEPSPRVVPPTTAASAGATSTSGKSLEMPSMITEAQLVEHRREVEAALKRPALHSDQ